MESLKIEIENNGHFESLDSKKESVIEYVLHRYLKRFKQIFF